MKLVKWTMVGLTIALVTGLVAYGGLRQNRAAQAADPTPAPGQRGQATPGAGGACASNEDATHEAQETAEQEAAENACQGGGRGGPGAFGNGLGDLLGAAATRLNITREALQQELQGGKTLAQVATGHGVSRDQLKASLTTAAQTAIQQAVTSGRLTQAQAAQETSNLSQRLDQLLDRTGGARGPGGPGGPRPSGTPRSGPSGTPRSGTPGSATPTR